MPPPSCVTMFLKFERYIFHNEKTWEWYIFNWSCDLHMQCTIPHHGVELNIQYMYLHHISLWLEYACFLPFWPTSFYFLPNFQTLAGKKLYFFYLGHPHLFKISKLKQKTLLDQTIALSTFHRLLRCHVVLLS